MGTVAYRLATIADLDVMVRLRVAMQVEVGHGDPAKAPLLEAALSDYFKVAIPKGEFIAYLGECDGQVVGASGMVFHSHPPSGNDLTGSEAYIMNMYTLPVYRGRGIATELLKRLLDVARQRECPRVVLYALPKGRGIYEREGFVTSEGSMALKLP